MSICVDTSPQDTLPFPDSHEAPSNQRTKNAQCITDNALKP